MYIGNNSTLLRKGKDQTTHGVTQSKTIYEKRSR